LDRVANPDHIKHHDFSPGVTCSGCGTPLMPSSRVDFEDFQARNVIGYMSSAPTDSPVIISMPIVVVLRWNGWG
jgi:hypothetical protein